MKIYTSTGQPVDFCIDCAPAEEVALELYGNMGDGPDGRGNLFAYDADHPGYDGEYYRCQACRKRLYQVDN